MDPESSKLLRQNLLVEGVIGLIENALSTDSPAQFLNCWNYTSKDGPTQYFPYSTQLLNTGYK